MSHSSGGCFFVCLGLVLFRCCCCVCMSVRAGLNACVFVILILFGTFVWLVVSLYLM